MERKLEVDYILLGVALLLTGLSIFTLYSLDASGDRWLKQFMFSLVSLGGLYFFARLNYLTLSKHAITIYAIGLFFLLITLIPGIGSEVKGARSWLRIGDYGLQTSQFANLGVVILLARYLRVQGIDTDKIHSLYISFGIVALPMLLIIVQPDLGGAMFHMAILLLVLFLSGGNIFHIGSILLFFFVVIFIPLYIGYFRIILIEPLINQLADLERIELVRFVEILGTNIWEVIDNKLLQRPIDGQQGIFVQGILNDSNLLQILRETVQSVRLENGGYLLLLAENSKLLIITGIICCSVSAVLWSIFYFFGSIGSLVARRNLLIVLKKIFIINAIVGSSLITAGAAPSVIKIQLHQVARITAFINPENFSRDLAYQIRAAKVAIGSGKVIGQGFFSVNMTVGKKPLVPEAETDFIFCAWAERTGFLGSLFLILCYCLLLVRAFLISVNAGDRLGTLLGAGIGCMFFFNILINIGISLGLFPVTGLPLPFFSYGGSHLLSSYIGIGILFSIHARRHTN